MTSMLRANASEDARRFDGFIRKQYQGLVQFLRVRTSSRQDAEDAAQESIVKLLRYRASAPASDWQRLLYRIAINAAHDRFRDAQRRHVAAQVAIDGHEIAPREDSPEEFAAHEQTLMRLRQAILRLPPKRQRVCLLKLAHGMTNAQIASHCGISTKMVEKHLAKALAKLRQTVGKSAPGAFK